MCIGKQIKATEEDFHFFSQCMQHLMTLWIWDFQFWFKTFLGLNLWKHKLRLFKTCRNPDIWPPSFVDIDIKNPYYHLPTVTKSFRPILRNIICSRKVLENGLKIICALEEIFKEYLFLHNNYSPLHDSTLLPLAGHNWICNFTNTKILPILFCFILHTLCWLVFY